MQSTSPACSLSPAVSQGWLVEMRLPHPERPCQELHPAQAEPCRSPEHPQMGQAVPASPGSLAQLLGEQPSSTTLTPGKSSCRQGLAPWEGPTGTSGVAAQEKGMLLTLAGFRTTGCERRLQNSLWKPITDLHQLLQTTPKWCTKSLGNAFEFGPFSDAAWAGCLSQDRLDQTIPEVPSHLGFHNSMIPFLCGCLAGPWHSVSCKISQINPQCN